MDIHPEEYTAGVCKDGKNATSQPECEEVGKFKTKKKAEKAAQEAADQKNNEADKCFDWDVPDL